MSDYENNILRNLNREEFLNWFKERMNDGFTLSGNPDVWEVEIDNKPYRFSVMESTDVRGAYSFIVNLNETTYPTSIEITFTSVDIYQEPDDKEIIFDFYVKDIMTGSFDMLGDFS